MIRGFVLLLGCQLAGEAAYRGLGLPVPGPVLGLLLLLVVLRLRSWIRPATDDGSGEVGHVADGLLRNLALLFVPAGVGVVQHLDVVAQYGLGLVAALVVSTAATLAVTALVFAATARALGLRPGASR